MVRCHPLFTVHYCLATPHVYVHVSPIESHLTTLEATHVVAGVCLAKIRGLLTPCLLFVAIPKAIISNELTVEDEGDYDAARAAESTTVVSQPLFASLERLGLQISTVPTKILGFFREFDRVIVSQYRPQHFWVFDRAEVEFHGFWVPRDRVQFLEAMWKKYGNFIAYFKLGVFVRGSMLTLLCCVLAQMRNTNLDDVTEAKILEWKSIVQELMKEGFYLDFILDHLREVA
uniref:Uncharacterized protein n=1 Tax=Fagus sylvatica TaxID=28930 RepID=A0A2N9J6L8_FAGSY